MNTASRVTDLTPATNAFLADMMVNLERSEESGGEYSSQQGFLWLHGTKPYEGLSALAVAKPTQFLGVFKIQLYFPGPDGSMFRTAHQTQLIKEMTEKLCANGWEVVPGESGREVTTSSDGIVVLVRRASKVSSED